MMRSGVVVDEESIEAYFWGEVEVWDEMVASLVYKGDETSRGIVGLYGAWNLGYCLESTVSYKEDESVVGVHKGGLIGRPLLLWVLMSETLAGQRLLT